MDDDVLKISNKELKKHFVRARLEKVCNCKGVSILVDEKNRVVECSECGAVLDPFDILVRLCDREDWYWNNIKNLQNEKENLEKWLLSNRMGSTLRRIASYIRTGHIPCCPHCNEPFDLEKLTTWCSKDYAISRVTKKMFEFKED